MVKYFLSSAQNTVMYFVISTKYTVACVGKKLILDTLTCSAWLQDKDSSDKAIMMMLMMLILLMMIVTMIMRMIMMTMMKIHCRQRQWKVGYKTRTQVIKQ